MCNLYNISTNQEAMRALGKVANDILGNLEPLIDAYPDRPAPVVRNMPGGRELAALTWGMPSPSFVTKGNPDTGVTNIRHIESKHWQPWRSVEHRCLVPWTKFCEEDKALVCDQRGEAASLLRWYLDDMEWCPRFTENATARHPRAIRFLDV